MDRGLRWATVHGVIKTQTQLKKLSTQEPESHLSLCPQANRILHRTHWNHDREHTAQRLELLCDSE